MGLHHLWGVRSLDFPDQTTFTGLFQLFGWLLIQGMRSRPKRLFERLACGGIAVEPGPGTVQCPLYILQAYKYMPKRNLEKVLR